VSAYTDEQLVDFFVRSSAAFGEQVREVDGDEWFALTPCADWDVRMVVAHVVVGDAQVPLLVNGEAVERVEEFDPSVLGNNPLAAWRGTALAAIRAFARPGVLAQRFAHPIGNITGRRIIGFRITDSLVHAWDIARARGDDVVLDPAIAGYCLDFWQPMAAGLPASGFFGPAVEPPAAADPGRRLLSLLGRSQGEGTGPRGPRWSGDLS
jgi:uncharacterized protein (TIGR03086 family)